MTDQEAVILERSGAVARITFNRPDVLNAFNRECAVALLDAVRAIAIDDAVRVVVMKGNGRAFMAGGDVRTFNVPREEAPALFASMLEPFHEAMEIMTALRQPVVAAVHGAVAGGGFSLAMAADIVFAADDCRFTMGYTKLGLSADGSISWSLPRLVGLRRALEMALLSEIYDAGDALRLGLINRVVPVDDLARETEALVERLANAPTIALGHMKRLMRQSVDHSLKEQMDAERDALVACSLSDDFAEGVAGYVQKRRPLFVGK
jgi:2-(1,2-epoxy-1,2-dihydrophenyl)acetyl-CoA isomerase